MGSEATDRRKVSIMPLAVLLPRLGEVSSIANFAEAFQQRVEEIQQQRDGEEIGTEHDLRRLLNEEAMLTQVLQWLSVEGNERR